MDVAPFKSSEENLFSLLLGGDILLLLLVLTGLSEAVSHSEPGIRMSALLFVCVTVLTSSILDLYTPIAPDKTKSTLGQALLAISIPVVITMLLFSQDSSDYLFWGLVGCAFLVLQRGWRAVVNALLSRQVFLKHVLVIGTSERALEARRLVELSRTHDFSGFVQSTYDLRSDELNEEDIVCDIDEIAEYVSSHPVDVIVNALKERRGNLPTAQLLRCKLLGAATVDFPTFYEHMAGKLPVEDMNPSWLVFNSGFHVSRLSRLVKRWWDILLAAVGLAISLPLLPLIAVAVKLTSPGPVLYQQTRVGEGGKTFTILKFRSMRADAEARTGAVMSKPGDTRITPIGQFLRRSRLDELPQLFNVLRGDMSFIGPRPERPEFVEEIVKSTPYYVERHFIKPGLTGWAQIKYPYGDSLGDTVEKLRYDLYYINNFNFLLDVFILLETVKVVLKQKYGR